ncbi:MAG: helix-turn-helix transcriptional regulator, partial [Acidimicrobiales bacterium]
MDRLERLVNLVAALLEADRPLTRAELRTRVGGYAADDDAFRRNFERDKDTLRQMGLPLETVALDPDQSDEPAAYRIPRERYELPDPGLTEEELTALRIAASAVRLDGPWADEASRRALRKLAAAGGPRADPGAQGGEATGAGTAEAPGGAIGPGLTELAGSDAVATAFGAVAERRRLRFAYHGQDRIVDPWGLSYRNGHWYLSGFDHGRGEERLFRLDRVGAAVRADEDAAAFERPPGRAAAPIPPWRLGDDPEVEVALLVDADQAPWAVASAGEEAVAERRGDGAVVVALRVTNRAALRSWAVGVLDHA